jgi:hypothetical protein
VISEIYAAINANLLEAGHEFEMKLGEEYLNEQSTPPRIVLYPVIETYEPPSQRNKITAKTATTQKQIQTVLKRRTVTLEAALWGCDYAEVETLLLPAFLQALGTATDSTENLGQGRWYSSQQGGQFQESGRLLFLPFSVALAVKGVSAKVARVTDIPFTGYLEPKPEEDI